MKDLNFDIINAFLELKCNVCKVQPFHTKGIILFPCIVGKKCKYYMEFETKFTTFNSLKRIKDLFVKITFLKMSKVARLFDMLQITLHNVLFFIT